MVCGKGDAGNAWFERIGVAADQRIIVTTAVKDDAGVSHDYPGPERAVQTGCKTHHVALLVNDRDVAGVAVMAGVTVESDLHRSAGGTCGPKRLLGSSWP